MKTGIKPATAQKIASYWHGGQWSAFYQFSSSGVIVKENVLQYLKEVEICLHPEYALYPGTISKTALKQLTGLKEFFISQINSMFGITIEYSKHPIYGYLIPYIKTGSTENVKKLTYLI